MESGGIRLTHREVSDKCSGTYALGSQEIFPSARICWQTNERRVESVEYIITQKGIDSFRLIRTCYANCLPPPPLPFTSSLFSSPISLQRLSNQPFFFAVPPPTERSIVNPSTRLLQSRAEPSSPITTNQKPASTNR